MAFGTEHSVLSIALATVASSNHSPKCVSAFWSNIIKGWISTNGKGGRPHIVAGGAERGLSCRPCRLAFRNPCPALCTPLHLRLNLPSCMPGTLATGENMLHGFTVHSTGMRQGGPTLLCATRAGTTGTAPFSRPTVNRAARRMPQHAHAYTAQRGSAAPLRPLPALPRDGPRPCCRHWAGSSWSRRGAPPSPRSCAAVWSPF